MQLGGTFRKGKKPVEENADALKTLFERMQKGGGPVGGLAGRLQSLRGLLAGGGALVVGAVAFAGALLAVAAAATFAVGALLKYGIAAADAYRSERLQLEGLTKIRNWYGLAAGKAGEMQAAIDRVSGSVALERGEIVGLQADLYKVGFRGAALENALMGVATATAAAGKEQGELAKHSFIAFGRTAAGAKKVGDDIKKRFGAIAAAQMLSLNVQAKKLKENFAALFTGLKIEGFLSGLKSVTDLFSQNTAVGRALKAILETTLQPLIDGIAFLGPIAKRFFQGMTLAALKLAHTYYDIRLAFKGAFGDTSLFKNVDLLSLALDAGKIAVYSLAVGVAILAAGMYGSYIAAKAAVAPFVMFGQAVYGAWSFIGGIDWGALGSGLIDGFVGGIKRGIGRVVSAVKGVASAALETLRGALDSHSPSRKGFSLGRTYPQGVGVGIEKEIPFVARAARRVGVAVEAGAGAEMPGRRAVPSLDLAPPMPTRPGGAGSRFGGSAGGPSGAPVTINAPITINVEGGGTPDELIERIRQVCEEQILASLRVAALSAGAKAA